MPHVRKIGPMFLQKYFPSEFQENIQLIDVKHRSVSDLSFPRNYIWTTWPCVPKVNEAKGAYKGVSHVLQTAYKITV
jgi:hypothetical protein